MLDVQGLILAGYAIISLVLPLPVRWWKRIIFALLIFACGLKFHIYREVGGIMSPNLPRAAILTLEALYGSLMLAVIFCLLKDVLSFVFYVLKKTGVPSFKLNRLKLHLFITAAAFIFGFFGTFSQLLVPSVQEEEIKIKNLGPAFEGFRVVQLTDLHIGPILRGDFIDGIVDKVNELKPDLVLITGDFVDGQVQRLKTEFQGLSRLEAPILGVTGNHEYYSGASAWISALGEFGVRFLQNEHVVISRGDDKLIVGGVNDRRSGRSSIEEAFRNAPEGPRILMAHEPHDGTHEIAADFILSGHTHGGTMIFLQPLIASYNDGYVSGLYDLGNSKSLYVSNGTGIWSGFSCRFLVPAEITLFTLSTADGA